MPFDHLGNEGQHCVDQRLRVGARLQRFSGKAETQPVKLAKAKNAMHRFADDAARESGIGCGHRFGIDHSGRIGDRLGARGGGKMFDQ